MTGPTPTMLRDALAGERRALRAFVDALTPIVQARVVRVLLRRRSLEGEGRDIRQEVADVTQDVFVTLFAHGGRTLRAWDPARGLSLPNFVGLVAEREAASILRNARRNPWKDPPRELDDLERAMDPVADAESQVLSRQRLRLLLDRMREALSPRGLELFERLYVEEEAIDSVAASFGMTKEAVYAWRNRVGVLVRQFAGEIHDESTLEHAELPRNTNARERFRHE